MNAITVTLTLAPTVYRPAEVTGDLVRRALEQMKRRNERMAKYMARARREGKPW